MAVIVSVADQGAQRPQNPLIEEYTLNYNRNPNPQLGVLESLGSRVQHACCAVVLRVWGLEFRV